MVSARGDQLIETAQRRGIAFSIDESTLERFGATDGADFLRRVTEALSRVPASIQYSRVRWEIQNLRGILSDQTTVVTRDDLKAFVSDDHIALEPAEMTAELKLLMTAIDAGYRRLVDVLNWADYEDLRFRHRKLVMGRSETALAWTDGRNTIWIDTEHARLLRRGYAGAYRVAATLLHEMLHDGPDTGTHQHDHAFYQAFHDLSSGLEIDPVGQAVERMVTIFTTKLRQDGKKVTKTLLKSDDADAAIAALRDRLDAEEEKAPAEEA